MVLRAVLTLSLLVGWAASTIVPLAHRAPQGTWLTLPNITVAGVQSPRQEHSLALVGDDMYVLGGILPFNGETYPTINTVHKYNFITSTWTEVAPMPAALNHVNVAVVNGLIYYLGGLAATGPTYWNASGASAVYNPSTNKWTVLPDVPLGRATGSAATMVVGETVYLPGGLLYTNLTNDDEGTTPIFTSYNVRTKKWNLLPDLPAPRDHAGKAVYRNTLYILGGRLFGHWNVTDTVFGYDIRTQRWSTNYAPMPTGRGGCASATIGSTTFTAGGEGNPNTANNLWPQTQAYDAARNTWTNYSDMSTPLHGTDAVVYKGKVIIAGGGLKTGGDPTQLVLSFTPGGGVCQSRKAT